MAVTLSLSITQNSQNTTNNTSNVTVKATATWTYGSWNATGQCTGSITIDGVQYSFSGITFNTGKTTSGSQVVMSKTLNVSHNSDGTKTLSCSALFATGVSSGIISATASKTLTTIPRATTPTVSSSSVYMGSAVTIKTPRASSNFKHDLAYSFAGGSYVSIATGVGTSYSWTTPDLASKIPNATSGTVTIRCITKNGSTTVGTKTVTMTLKVPTSVVPTISAVTVVEAVDGLAAQFGAYIQNKSKIKTTITAAGAKGSTIKSYSTTLPGKTYSGSSWTSDLLTSSGSIDLVTTVTDSRGRTAKKTTTITVLPYSIPVITAFRAYRCGSDGTPADDGTTMAVQYAYTAPSLNGGNTVTAEIQYKQSTAVDYEEEPVYSGSGLSGTGTLVIASPEFSTDYQYNVRLTVSDWFGGVAAYVTLLPSGAVILDIKADGLGLSFFKTAERTGVDFGASAKGAVLGLWAATSEVPENGDLNDYTRPGVYAVAGNAIAATVLNIPTPMGGTLRVWTGLGTEKIDGEWAYIVQEFNCYDPVVPVYRRLLVSDETGVFTARPWQAISVKEQTVLWAGALYMTAGHEAVLDQTVAEQNNGIVLVFSRYDGAPVSWGWHSFYVPKTMTAWHPGNSHIFTMSDSKFSTMATKCLYIHNDKITGHADNSLTGTSSTGVKYANNGFVLRYVIGV